MTSLGQELDAIKAGRKPLSFFASDREAIEDGSDLIPIMRAAFDRGLAVVAAPRGDTTDLFVVRPEHLARVSQFQAFLAKQTRWSFSVEDQQSRLLGYSKAERAAWMKQLRASHIELGMTTVYAIGDRLFAKRPAGAKVLRYGIDGRTYAKVFGRSSEVTLTKARKKTFLAGVLAGPEVLGPRGWTRA